MKDKMKQLVRYKKYILFLFATGTVIYLTINPTLLALKARTPKPFTKVTEKQIITITPKISALPLQNKPTKSILAAAIEVQQTPKPTALPTAISIPTKILTEAPPFTVSPTQPVHTTVLQPIQSSPSSTLAPTAISQSVNLQLQFPNHTITTTIILKPNANACDILQEAKNENKINSLTFDDSYLSMMHSRYVKEINGLQNNWTFTVNGIAPLGCSLSNPKSNDTIIWKFN